MSHTKCTPELTRAICDALADGGYAVDAAAYVGIHESTFYDWMQRGKDGESPFAEFAESVGDAMRKRTHTWVSEIRKEDDWKALAWLLERMDPERFGRKEKQDVTASVRQDYSHLSDEEQKRLLELALGQVTTRMGEKKHE